MTLAKTEAAGGPGLLPAVLSFSSSLSLDRQLLFEDVIGSLAHVTMLGRSGVIPLTEARAIRAGLIAIWERAARGELTLPDEEDVHMAVEVELNRTIGAPAALLHSARSRNDQVATDLRLHVREAAARSLDALTALISEIIARARAEKDLMLPSYTHRQRAQPVSVAYWLASYASAFVRDARALAFVLDGCRQLPLGVGAISGTSLPINRDVTRALLAFEELTLNGMDTVGDRDFALDFMYATARFMVHASRLSTDFIDFTTSEFGFATLSGDISMGSSMMPQKKNPDVFELVRGKSGRAVGNLVGLLVTVKGLPGGYNRDLQEDRASLLETAPLLGGVLEVLRLALPRVTFDAAKCRSGLDEGFTQATDLAEALVKKGMPFRRAYQVIGSLVRRCQEQKLTLRQVSLELAQSVDPMLDAATLAVLDPVQAVAHKRSAGSTGPEAVSASLNELERQTNELSRRARAVPTLTHIFSTLKEAEL